MPWRMPYPIKALTGCQALGILHVLAEVVKIGGSDQLIDRFESMRQVMQLITSTENLSSNTLIKKWKVKLLCRMTLAILPAKRDYSGRGTASTSFRREWS